MTHLKLLAELESLPREAQRQVVDFISFLKRHHNLVRRPTKQDAKNLSRQAFIGMWQDREDLKDSSAWVRQTRRQEWPNS